MSNCLVTKLKGIVPDNTLPKLGDLFIPIKNYRPANLSVSVKDGKSTTISVVGDGSFTPVAGGEPQSTVNVNSTDLVSFLVSSDTNKIRISNKYYLTRLIFNQDIESFDFVKYMPAIEEFDLGYENGFELSGCIDNLKDLNLSKFRLFLNENATGNIANLPDCLIRIQASRIANKPTLQVVGDISELKCTSQSFISMLYLPGISGNIRELSLSNGLNDKQIAFTGCAKLTGEIESFLAKYTEIYKGTSYTISINYGYTNITYKGEKLLASKLMKFICDSSGTWSLIG